jgi:hypothetical protein
MNMLVQTTAEAVALATAREKRRRNEHAASEAPTPSDYTQVAGIMIPTKRRVFPRGPDGQALTSEPITVSIDLSEIAFT